MKLFTVRIGTVARGPKMRVRVMARTGNAAFTKAFKEFAARYPAILERRLSVGGEVSPRA